MREGSGPRWRIELLGRLRVAADERRRLSRAFGRRARGLSAALWRAGNPEAAFDLARRAVAVDPLSEESHRHLMRLHQAAGDPGAALRQYDDLARRLHPRQGML